MKQIRVRISDEIYEKILLLSKQKSTNKNALVNSAILAFLNKENKLFLSENSKEKLTHIIQIKTSVKRKSKNTPLIHIKNAPLKFAFKGKL